MKHCLILEIGILFATMGLAQPTISGIVTDDVGHSSFRVTWNPSVSATNQRIEWGPTSAYGRTFYTYEPKYSATRNQILLSGLSTSSDFDAFRTVHFRVCSEAGTWGCSGDQTVTLAAVPFVHPAEATLPATFTPIAQPSEAGCTTRTISADYSNLQSEVNAAVAAQPTTCQVIVIPSGASGNVGLVIPPAADSDRVTSANANTTTNVLTPTTPTKSTYANGMRVRVANDGYNGDSIPSGLYEGKDYCVTNYAAGAFTLAAWPACGATIPLVSSGGGAWYLMPFPPPHSNYITIRSADTAQPPDGVRTTPEWRKSTSPKMFPPVLGKFSLNYSILFRSMAHHWHIGPGINFTTWPTSQTDTTDPFPWMGWLSTPPSASYVAIKRNWFNGGGYPERIYSPMYLEGSYVDFSDNYQENIDYWRPTRVGMAMSVAGNTLSIASGSFYTGITTCASIPATTAVVSGAGAGTVYVTVRPSDCAVLLTSTATIACTGCVTSSGSDWPRNGGGRYAHGLVGSCPYSAGTWGACSQIEPYQMSADGGEAPTAHLISSGPGPGRIANNYEESHEIFWHIENSKTESDPNTPLASDYVFERNVFAIPDKYRFGTAANLAQVAGTYYQNRNQWECKRCLRVHLKGNEFYGGFQTSTNSAPAILINGNTLYDSGIDPVAEASDITITSNWIHDSVGGMLLGGGPPGASKVTKLGRRLTVRNNLLRNMDGWTYNDLITRPSQQGWGYCFQPKAGGEDLIIDHNTCYSAGGIYSAWAVPVSKMMEGVAVTNNLFYFHQDAARDGMVIDWGSYGTGVPNCFGLAGKAGLDCWLNQNYTFKGNVFIGGYTNSQAMTGESSASAISTAYSGLSGNYFPTDSTVAARVAGRKFRSVAKGNFRLATDSPHISGGAQRAADNLDVGVNQDALEDALGHVKNVRSVVTGATTATVYFHAPDAGAACYIGYGTAPQPYAWSRTAADTAASQERTINLTGLSAGTAYYLQPWCVGTAAPATSSFVTKAI